MATRDLPGRTHFERLAQASSCIASSHHRRRYSASLGEGGQASVWGRRGDRASGFDLGVASAVDNS